MADLTVSSDVDDMLAAANNLAIRAAINADVAELTYTISATPTTAIAIADSVYCFYMPFAMTLNAGKLGLTINVFGAPVTGPVTCDILQGTVASHTTILSTALTIDAAEFSSDDAGTPCVISDTTLDAGVAIIVDLDAVGSGGAATGLGLILRGIRTD